MAARVLDRERILDAALALVDQGGLAALTMRRLGAELGVDPMAVYRHLDGKRGVVRALTERVYAALPAPPPDLPYAERVRRWAHGYRDLGLAHPGLVLGILSDPAAIAVAALHSGEALYAALEDAGLGAEGIVRAADLVVDYVHGAVVAEAAAGADPGALGAELARRPEGQFPVQRRVLAAAPAADAPLAGLDVVLAGVQALVHATPIHPDRAEETP